MSWCGTHRRKQRVHPPDLLRLEDFGGSWDDYETELYRIFIEEIVHGNLQFRGLPVRCRDQKVENHLKLFWHLVQTGHVEEERMPDLRRCERIRWVRWVIENSARNPRIIDEWENTRGINVNALLWYRKEYLVVLTRRKDYWLLTTAYCTEYPRRREKLQKERDKFHSQSNE